MYCCMFDGTWTYYLITFHGKTCSFCILSLFYDFRTRNSCLLYSAKFLTFQWNKQATFNRFFMCFDKFHSKCIRDKNKKLSSWPFNVINKQHLIGFSCVLTSFIRNVLEITKNTGLLSDGLTLWCWNRNIPSHLVHDWWCPGSVRHHVIISHVIEYMSMA